MNEVSKDKAGSHLSPEVDPELCVACNACVVICPASAVQFVRSGEDQAARIFQELCTGCQLCLDLCCWGAIKVKG